MLIDPGNFTPGFSLTGGLVIGAAAAVLILFNGRIAGISGIFGGLLNWPRDDVNWRLAFLVGLVGRARHRGTVGQVCAGGNRGELGRDPCSRVSGRYRHPLCQRLH